MSVSKLAPLLRNQCGLIRRNLINPSIYFAHTPIKYYSENKSNSSLSHAKPSSDVSTDVRPIGEKIKEGAKTASYTGVILFGVGVTGIIFYYVFRELFSSQSANSIYSSALQRCIEDPYVQTALGPPIKGYGEESGRRRRNHVSHAFYERDGVKCIRMQFYIKGTKTEGTVQVDMKEVNGKFEYRYLLVQLNNYAQRVIIVEDNRAEVDKKPITSDQLQPLPNMM